MDAESLKIILELKEENILLHRAITDAILMLNRRKKHPVSEYGIADVSFLFSEISKILAPPENKQQLSDKPVTVRIAN